MLKVSAGQVLQTRSEAGEPGRVTKVPASQFDQVEQKAAFELALNPPSLQTAHAWSEVVVPEAATNVPASHVVQGAQTRFELDDGGAAPK